MYATINSLHKIPNANVTSSSTSLGCGMLGNLYLNLSPTVYTTLSIITVVNPPNPEAAPITPICLTGLEAVRHLQDELVC